MKHKYFTSNPKITLEDLEKLLHDTPSYTHEFIHSFFDTDRKSHDPSLPRKLLLDYRRLDVAVYSQHGTWLGNDYMYRCELWRFYLSCKPKVIPIDGTWRDA